MSHIYIYVYTYLELPIGVGVTSTIISTCMILSFPSYRSDSSESRDKQNKNSLNRLRNYIKQKKEASPKTADTDDPLSENWKPNFLNNRICIQSDGGMKSKPVSITLAQRIPIPLYYPVSVDYNILSSECG